MAKTKAHVKDGHLVILAQDASPPGVVSLPLEQAKTGGFELSTEGGTAKLSFKPAGRKTGDVIAVYGHYSRAEKALRNVYDALGGTGGTRKIFKLIGLGLLVLLGLWILLSVAVALFEKKPSSSDAIVGSQPEAIGAPLVSSSGGALPAGEPFPVDDYVQQLQEQQKTYEGE